jgi:hypothetical protein
MLARVTPWSSIVGTSVVIEDEKGANVAVLMVMMPNLTKVPNDEVRHHHLGLAHAVADAINDKAKVKTAPDDECPRCGDQRERVSCLVPGCPRAT